MMTIQQLIAIVRDASGLMVTDGFDIEQKDGCENIVTSSDVAVQDFLCQQLSLLMPSSGFLCEEKDRNDAQLHEYTWIIDPIDGTANYSRGIDQCAICVGLKHGEEMEMGVVYLPRTDEMFYAEKGREPSATAKAYTCLSVPSTTVCCVLPCPSITRSIRTSVHESSSMPSTNATTFAGLEPVLRSYAIWRWADVSCISNICSVPGIMLLPH